MSSISARLQRLEAVVGARPVAVDPAEHAATLASAYGKLSAAGLVVWNEQKNYWAPADARALRGLLQEKIGGKSWA